MTQDYARHSAKKRRQQKKRRKPLSWKMIIIFLLLALMIIVSAALWEHFKKTTPTTPPATSANKPLAIVREAKPIDLAKPIKPQLPDVDQTHSPARKIKFDFYTMLPKMSVTALNNSNASNHQNATHHRYILQVISLSHFDDAAQYQSSLTQAGFTSNIVPVYQNHVKWYRVQIGPFSTLAAAQAKQAALTADNFSSVILTRTNMP